MASSATTTVTNVDPREFIASVADERQRADAERLLEIVREETGATPRMWGPSMVGFGAYHYRYASGNDGVTFVVGFSPRAGRFALYDLLNAPGAESFLERLGAHTRGKGCLYVRRLGLVDEGVLRELIRVAWTSIGSRSNETVTITPTDVGS